MQIISKNRKETKKIAGGFLKKLLKHKGKSAYVLGLSGELGAGKTFLVQSIARALGVKRKVTSPTFLIIKRYPIKNKVFENIFHIDAYRLKQEGELLKLGWREIIRDPKNLVLIEWPERVKKIMPKKHIKVFISHVEENQRKIKVRF